VKPVVVFLGPTLPQDEARAVFDAQYLPEEGPEWKAIVQQVQHHPRLRAVTLLMRRAGLRISDAVTFHRDRLMADGSIFLYMSKTHEPVSVPVHPELRAALDTLQPNAAGFYFWSGQSEIATATDGVVAARLTGAGFGGSTVNLVRSDRVAAFRAAIERDYAARTGLTPRVLEVDAVAGASYVAG